MISWPNSLPLSLLEWHAEPRQEAACLVVGAGGRDDRHLEPAQLVDLVVVDLREHDLLAQTERVVAASVEAVDLDAAKVADARQGDVQELVQEVPHAPAPQRRLDAHRLARPELERGDGLPGLDQLGLLAADGGDVTHRGVQRLVVVLGLADADVDDDLVDAGHLHDIAVVELLGHVLRDGVAVQREKARRFRRPRAGVLRSLLLLRLLLLRLRHYWASVLRTRSYGSPQWRQTRARAPDSSTVCLVRVGRPQLGQTSMTLEQSSGASKSTMPPCATCTPPRRCPALVWRLSRLTPLTTILCWSGRVRRTSPCLPLSLPAMTMTGSPAASSSQRRLDWVLFFSMSSLQDLRRERDDLHEVALAELAGDRSEDTS